MRAEKTCVCLPPVIRADARVLVLGSMPGQVSLAAGQYYAHPRNAFWPMLYAYFRQPIEENYEKRIAFALGHGIALWDSAAACMRTGSLDTAMREIELNDFGAVFAACPNLRAVACNGAKSYALFMKSAYATRLTVLAMPSTSPAYAAMRPEEKAAQWARVFALTKEG